MESCSFCGDPRSMAWLLIAGPDVAVCDRCLRDLGDIAEETGPGVSGSDLFGPCRFCGRTGSEERLIVGNALLDGSPPVICHGCVTLAASVAADRVPFDDPWYRPLRFEGGDGIGPDGADPEDAEPLIDDARARLSEVQAGVDARLAELERLGLPTGGDVPEIVRRKAVGDLLGRIGVERGRRIPIGVALTVARAL